MTTRAKAPHAAAAVLALLATLACDDLGNPPPSAGATQPVQWRSPIVALTTQSQTVPYSRADDLFRRLPPSSLDHYERPEAGALTLVTVEPRWAGRVRIGTVPVVTRLTYSDGTVDERHWAAPTTVRVWRAAFAVPSAPVSAVTVLAR